MMSMPHAGQEEILKVDPAGARGAVIEADQAKAVTVGVDIEAAADDTTGNIQKVAHTRTFSFERCNMLI